MSEFKSVILTGASDGIGRAMALEFARRGFSLGLLARRKELLDTLSTECTKLGAPQVFTEVADVSDEVRFEQALLLLDQKIGGAQIFIANAGITGRSDFTINSWKHTKRTLEVNVMGAAHGLEFMKFKMLERKHGILVGVSSVAGARGMPTAGAYASSKAFLTAHLETMRVDLLPKNIKVVTIAPGFIDTAMTKLNKGTMPFLSTPEQAAKVFVNGILKEKAWVMYPRPYRFIYPVLQMIPRGIFDYLFSRLYSKIR